MQHSLTDVVWHMQYSFAERSVYWLSIRYAPMVLWCIPMRQETTISLGPCWFHIVTNCFHYRFASHLTISFWKRTKDLLSVDVFDGDTSVLILKKRNSRDLTD